MDKIFSNSTSNRLLLFFLALVAMAGQSACRKDEQKAGPVITHVRNYAASPNDTLVTSVFAGQWVVLSGHGLSDALQVSFNGVPASIKSVMFSDTTAVMQVPAVIPFPTIPAEKLNVITYVTSKGTTSYKFDILAPPPTITSISNENAKAGDSVYIYGSNLFFIEKLSFAGEVISDFSMAADGTVVGFILPHLAHSGKVVVTTKSGVDSTRFNVNDPVTGVICNFDDINPFSWGTNLENSSTEFPGNSGTYAVLKNDVLAAGDGTWWNNQRSINTNNVQWIPKDSLNTAIDGYALKFELNVPSTWNGTTLYVVRNYDMAFLARYEPWVSSTGAAVNYSAKGWRTVTIPLTMFRTNSGKGVSAGSLTELLGADAFSPINIQTANFLSVPTATGFYGAIDNIRIVKIK
ncbi:hypothetical protein J2T02_004685 [Chitinophaga terrae (ex Kim and Jung 2007)]|uniref:glycan-binding surface protein n=1 Tax=Chitinophaga terrae (ex Kim and Jung 2007) TaxID=408074 RepID=UPI002782DC70|nr:glycan-binding surface protein [Chitinophaga terrae (ex Kim and Jung 2007)]MDQ0109541.1 hypothetical protein [Chitinophaga terrae (ex Kim and Jung 2007)]